MTGLDSTAPHAVTPFPASARPGSAWQDAKSRAHLPWVVGSGVSIDTARIHALYLCGGGRANMHKRERRDNRGCSLHSEELGGRVSGQAHASRQPSKLKMASTWDGRKGRRFWSTVVDYVQAWVDWLLDPTPSGWLRTTQKGL